MFRFASTVVAVAALAAPTVALANQGGSPSPGSNTLQFAAGEACAFPVEIQSSGKSKSMPFKGGRVITLFAQSVTTAVNLADPSKSITVRGGGNWHDVILPSGAILGSMSGHSYIVGNPFGLLLLIGQFSVVIAPDGQITEPPVGNGRQVQLCDLIA